MSKAIIEAARNAGLDVRSYSGRGMYGAKCLGIDFDSSYTPVYVVCEIARAFMDNSDMSLRDSQSKLHEMLYQLGTKARTDSMGMGQIVYWPDIEWQDEDSDCPTCDGECLDCPNCFKKASE